MPIARVGCNDQVECDDQGNRIVNQDPVFIDLTMLTVHPIHSGIQRVEREIIRHWSGPADLIPCRFDNPTETFIELPDTILQEIREGRDEEEERERLALLLPGKGRIANNDLARNLFNPEVFFDPVRLNAYRNLALVPQSRLAWLAYDFIPFLQPQYWPCRTTEELMHYVRALQKVPRVSFISEATRDAHVVENHPVDGSSWPSFSTRRRRLWNVEATIRP